MPLTINIASQNKKIVVPFNKDYSINEYIQLIIKRASLDINSKLKLFYQGGELYGEDTLEILGISDGVELNLHDENSSLPSPTIVNTPPPQTTNQNSDNNNNNNIIINATSNGEEIKQLDAIVLDLSASMKDKIFGEMMRIDFAQACFQTLIDKMISSEYPSACCLVCFGSSVTLQYPITKEFDSFSKNLGKQVADQTSTRLYEAIQLAAKTIVEKKSNPGTLKLSKKLVSRIFCLTDGQDNSDTPPFPVYQYLEDNNIIVDSFAIGDTGSRNILSSFTKATGGVCLLFNSVNEGIHLFEKEALLWLEKRKNFEPFSKHVANVAQFEKMAGTFVLNVETAVDNNVDLKCTNTITTTKIDSFQGSTYRRIAKEYKDLMVAQSGNSAPKFNVYLNESDIKIWKVIIKGPTGTPYDGGHWVISVLFTDSYPSSAPKFTFLTKIYHLNISSDGTLNNCMGFLSGWSATSTIQNALQSILNLLTTPNVDSPMDSVKCSLYRDNKTEYEIQAKQWKTLYSNSSIQVVKKQYNLE
ncbi:hypothetical protein DLAC_10592 [Tieghemostelium lacteum]|uniref:Ubiquitin-conjugating enzyme E2 n=1 Tax=Tieghemostelium lacteum TaxID=361077 RepID=A0A151Z4C6_TIELA|nr:hypothetical protein DLAC_10592 [Tieghemostelium lacteum]|eukprot:KYQ88795.1 hypothetical protein DLAC_10592 [Tieghemostelium lacteum]